MRGNAHVRFGGRAGETHITHVAQGAPVRPYYVKAGLEKQKAALLVVIGAMSDGRKEILTIVPGYRESKESWTSVLRDLRDRGLSAAKLLVADGHLGIWAALAQVWPETAEQRCWNHRLLNVLDKLPWGYPFNRSYHMFSAWRILALASTTRARLASFKPGFEPMRTAWTTSNGCGGPTASSVRVAATKAVGAWAMAASCVRRVRHAVR